MKKLIPLIILTLLSTPVFAQQKLSTLPSAGTYNPATDTFVLVRQGATTDYLYNFNFPPNCPTSGGTQALNYATSTGLFSCNSVSGGSSSTAFSALTGGTNTAAGMIVGTGASLAPSGSGTIAATSVNGETFPASGIIAGTTDTQTLTNKSIAGSEINSGVITPAVGGSGVSNTATVTLGTANHNYAALGTGLIKNTIATGALSNAVSSDIIGLFTGCTGVQYLGADGACHAAGGGSGSPGGINGQVQYNNSGVFGGLTNPAAMSKISSGIIVDPRNYGAQCTGGYGATPGGVTITTAGTGFAVNDTFEIADLTIGGRVRGGQLAKGHVTSVNGGGGITGITMDSPGSGYFTSTLWIQPLTGVGVGAALNITAINSFPSAPTTTLASGGSATGTGLGGSYNDGGAYAVGDIFAIPNPSVNGNYMTGRVTGVSAGRVTTYTINNPGGDYSIVSAVPAITLTGFGAGLTINVTSATSANGSFDDTYGIMVAANAANAFGGQVEAVDNCWIGTLMPPAGTAIVGQGYGVNYAYGNVPNNITPSTGPHWFIIGTPSVGIDFNGQANIALANFEVRGYTGATFGSNTTWTNTACIGGKNGGGNGSKEWLYNMSAKSCFTGLGSNDGTGGYIFAVSKNSDYAANQNGIYGPFSDFLSDGDTLLDSDHGIWMSSSAGGLLRIEHPRIEYVTTGIELDSGGLQADITGAEFDRASHCSLYVNGAQQVNVTGGNMKGGGLEGTLTVTGAASGTGGVVRLTVTGYGNNVNGGGSPTSGLITGDVANVSGIAGTTEGNGNQYTITVVDGTHIELQGTTFVHAWTSGGNVNVNGKGSYVCLNGSTDFHSSNVGYYGYSAGTPLAAASVVDSTGFSRISFDGGTANSGNSGTGGWQQAFGNFHNSSNAEPANFHKSVVNNPFFDNGPGVQGNGTKIQLSTGTTTTNDCVKFDANGNTVDAGSACGSGGGGVTSVTGTSPVVSSGGSTPAISISGVTAEQGNGAKLQLSTGATTTNDCVKFDANGNTVDAGSACGSGGSGITSIPLGSGLTITQGTANASPLVSGSSLYLTSYPNTYTGAHPVTAAESAGVDIYNSTSGGTFSLPQAGTTGFAAGTSYGFLNINTGALTVSTTTSVFNGVPLTGGNIVLAQYGNAVCISDGTNWNCTSGNSQALSTAGTGLSASSGTVSSNAVYQVSYQTGLVSALNATKGVVSKVSKASTVDNIEGSAITFSCISNPTITMYECGTSATCASPTTIGTVTITAAGTVVDGTVSNAAITAGDYIAFAETAGTCASSNIAITAQIHSN